MALSSAFAIIFVAVLVAAAVYLHRQLQELKKPRADETLLQWLRSMQQTLADTQRTLHQSLNSSNKSLTDTLSQQTRDIHERLTRAAEVIGELKREAGQFSEISRSMKELHEFLRSPKLRGNIGEQVLADLISQMIPKNSFHFQFAFKSGDKVDAAIKTDAGILPIDSKFPMENFQRMMGEEQKAEREKAAKEFANDVRRHIRAISSKYILLEEGTTDFAMMYVPSESVYYEIATSPELMEYARANRIYPVSPNTMYATLSIIMRAFQGKNFAEKSRQVFHLLRAVEKDYERLEESLGVLGTHIGNAYNKFNDVSDNMQLLGQKVNSTISLQEANQPQALEGAEA